MLNQPMARPPIGRKRSPTEARGGGASEPSSPARKRIRPAPDRAGAPMLADTLTNAVTIIGRQPI
jgi:hypothetical protein